MRIDDDTPVPGALPDPYPSRPPVNLVVEPELLSPSNFFAFEGIDGAGKSELIARLSRTFEQRALAVRRLKLGRSDVTSHALERAKWLNSNPMTFNLLSWVSIFEQVAEARFDLNRDDTLVFFDRYVLTVKVRGVLEGLSTAFMDALEAYAPRPATQFFIDCEPEVSLARILAGGRQITYFEGGARIVGGLHEPMVEESKHSRFSGNDRSKGLLKHLARMRSELLELARHQDNTIIIDNSGDPMRAAAIIAEAITERIAR
jgi:thymidylate kinase